MKIDSLHLGSIPPVFNFVRTLERPAEGDHVVSFYCKWLDIPALENTICLVHWYQCSRTHGEGVCWVVGSSLDLDLVLQKGHWFADGNHAFLRFTSQPWTFVPAMTGMRRCLYKRFAALVVSGPLSTSHICMFRARCVILVLDYLNVLQLMIWVLWYDLCTSVLPFLYVSVSILLLSA